MINILICKTKNNEKGSASVIVVIFMLVLIILSLTALLTAVANEKLTEKTHILLSDYSKLDTLAKEKYIEIYNGDINSYINRTKDDNQYIDYSVMDDSIPNKWIEVTLEVRNSELSVVKWIIVQKEFAIDEKTKYFDGDFEKN